MPDWHKYNRRDILRTVGASSTIGVAGLAGCGGDEGSGNGNGGNGNGEGDTIVIGQAMALSGQLGPRGKALHDGRRVMAHYINNELGGLDIGGTKRPIELKTYDDESSCQTTVQLYERLITEDEVDLLLGPFSSGCVNSVAPIIKKHERVAIVDGISDNIFEQHNDPEIYVFASLPTSQSFIKGPVQFAAANGAETLGMFSDQAEFGQSLREGTKAAAEEEGLSIEVDETVPQDTRSLSTPIRKMKEADVDLAMCNTHLELGVVALNAMKDQDFNPDSVYGGDGANEPDFYDGVGPGAKGTTFYTTWSSDLTTEGSPLIQAQKANETYKQYRDEGTVEDLQELSFGTAIGMADVQIMSAAAEAADSTDDDALREALMGFDFRSATGTLIKYQDNGKTEAAGFTGQIHSKEDKPIVYPPEVATGEPIYPKPEWSEF